jgi:hypothetical protein
MTQPHPPPGVQPERINLNDKVSTEAWIKKFNTTREQLREAIASVGDKAANVETHLKASSHVSYSNQTGWAGELSMSL